MTISAVRERGGGSDPASSDESSATAHAAPAPRDGTRSRTGMHLGTATVLLVGLLITAILSVGSLRVHNDNEDRLLRQRVREAAAVITAAIPNVQGPLASAAVLAESTAGARGPFTSLIQPLLAEGRPYVSASLWSVKGATPRPLIVVGARPELETRPPQEVERFLRSATGRVSINDLLSQRDRRLGYAYAVADPNAAYVVYVEAALPANRRSTVDKNSAFADLDYALYLGRSASRQELMASSTAGAVLGGGPRRSACPSATTACCW